ncbi:MAG: roadblock/LC7 domain-containing protein, partial [Candidatus Asgardarchaeia archaeon]
LRDKLRGILNELESIDPEIEASAIIRTDGLLMASSFRIDIDKNLVAAMNAAVLNISNRAATEMKRGKLQELIIRADNGIIALVNAGENAILSVIAKKDANLGLLLFEMKKAANKVINVLK